MGERRLEVIARPHFPDLVRKSEESRRTHHNMASALKSFGSFWTSVGGYEGNFDTATREDLNLALNVKPVLVDFSGQCGYSMHGGELCKKLKQRCETCGTVTGCCKHGDHSIAECRE